MRFLIAISNERRGARRSRLAVSRLLPRLILAAFVAVALASGPSRAEDGVTLSITMKDQKFDPPELHAPAGQPITIRVKNLNPIVSEFESGDLHFEKIVPVGGEGVIHVRPLQPGRYTFYDDFHHETQGALVVP